MNLRPLAVAAAGLLAAAATAYTGFAAADERADAPPSTQVTVGVKEWAFDLSQESAPAGDVVFTITNTGQSEPHDFAIYDRTSAVLMPGESTTMTVDFPRPGIYQYTDTRADSDREMYGSFTITAAAATTAPATTAAEMSLPLQHVADVPLPGSASRFDYQSVDPGRRRLFIAHLGGGDVLVFDLAGRRIVKDISNVAGAHGVLVVPRLRRLYAAATDEQQLVTIDEQSFRTIRRAIAGAYPDGIAYDPRHDLVFVSDEHGDQETIFEAKTGRRVGAVALGGDAGNVQYDATSHRILADIGSKDQLAVIDPKRRKIVRRVPLPGCSHAHGLHLDSARRLAFVACDQNAALLVLDLRTMRVVQTETVGDDPDVLDFDPGLRRLYVAAESGEVAVFRESGRRLQKLGQAKLADNAHSVAVDPRTHLVYFPLENVDGKPLLRIMRPTGV